MHVDREMLTVVADTDAREVCIVLAGLRVSLTPDETEHLSEMLLRTVERLATLPAEPRVSKEATELHELSERIAPDESTSASQSDLSTSTANDDESEARRALIRAKIRNKGLSLGDPHRS